MDESAAATNGACGGGGGLRTQSVVVMRHGDRMDAAEPLWVTHADRPWDPPLTDDGRTRAWTTGKRLRALPFTIHRIVVSPFLRCLQTASEVAAALCASVDDDALLALETSSGVATDDSRVKISVEYGLCEALCREAISANLIPTDGKLMPDVLVLEAKLTAGRLDCNVDRVYKELPMWEEPLADARIRYKAVFLALADKFPHENLLLVTHGEGVGVAVSSFKEHAVVFEVEYCGYVHLQRHLRFMPTPPPPPAECFAEEEGFNVVTMSDQSGVSYFEREADQSSPASISTTS